MKFSILADNATDAQLREVDRLRAALRPLGGEEVLDPGVKHDTAFYFAGTSPRPLEFLHAEARLAVCYTPGTIVRDEIGHAADLAILWHDPGADMQTVLNHYGTSARHLTPTDGPLWDARLRGAVTEAGHRRRPLDVLIVAGFGGPYGQIARAWQRAISRLGARALVGTGRPAELDWRPAGVLVLYARSIWDNRRGFYKRLRDLRAEGKGPAFWILGLEDPYESWPTRRIVRAVKPDLYLSTEPTSARFYDYPGWRYWPHAADASLGRPGEDRLEHQIGRERLEDADLAQLAKGMHVGVLGHCFGTRFAFFGMHPGLFSRFRWLTIGLDWYLNTTGRVLEFLPMRQAVAVIRRIGLAVNIHRDDATAVERWCAPEPAENLNQTAWQFAYSGIPQVMDVRAAAELHREAFPGPQFRTGPRLGRLIEEHLKARAEGEPLVPRVALEEARMHVRTFHTYESRAAWLLRQISPRVFQDFDPPRRTYAPRTAAKIELELTCCQRNVGFEAWDADPGPGWTEQPPAPRGVCAARAFRMEALEGAGGVILRAWRWLRQRFTGDST